MSENIDIFTAFICKLHSGKGESIIEARVSAGLDAEAA